MFLHEKIIIAVSLVLIMTGCKKNNTLNDRQIIFFQFDYINYAWGYQHNGYIIDREGNILTYTNPEKWNFPDDDFNLNEQQVAENISYCLKSSKKISKEELQRYALHIKNIASSKVTAPKNVSADAGSYEFICFQYSEYSGTYKGYIMKTEGDFTSENLNFFSKKIVSWMRTVNNSLPKN